MTDKQPINKNRKSKLSKLIDDNFNEFIIKPGVSLGRLAKELETPYNRLLSSNNPFLFTNDYDRALILVSLIDKIHDFSLDCVDPDIWILPEKKEVDKNREELIKKRNKIIDLINSLRPIEATKKPAHQYIRYCRFNTNSFLNSVDIIVKQLRDIYKQINLDRKYSLDRDAKREKAVEIFLENHSIGIKPSRKGGKWLKDLKVSDIYHRGYAFPKVALKIISKFANCDYSELEQIRTNHNKAKRTYLKLIK